MAELPEIATLWIGGRLSWLEQLCLKSFVDAGHHTTLYSYSPIDNVPDGVHTADAGVIFPEHPMLRHVRTGSPAIHADLWRLHLLKETQKIWVDADMYCYRPFDFSGGSVFGWEKKGLVCNAVLSLPGDSKALNGLLRFFEDEYAIAPWLKDWQQDALRAARDAGDPVHMTAQEWGFTGPASITWFLKESGEIKYSEPQTVFYPIPFRYRNHMIGPQFDIEQDLSDQTRGIHFWARRMKPRLAEKENNTPRPGSFLAKLIEKHGIDPAAAPIPKKTAKFSAPGPAPRAKPATPSTATIEYDELIETLGVRIPFDPKIITPRIERPMRNNRYEAGEAKGMQELLQPGDRVLEIGAGVGLVSAIAAKAPGVASVTAVEANPGLIPLIKETMHVNGVGNVTVKNGVVSNSRAKAMDFYLRADFWASSMEPDSRPYVEKKKIANIHIEDLIAQVDPTILSCDIEGAELGLFDEVDLSGVRHAILELHPKVYGADGVRSVVDVMAAKGFRLSPTNRVGGSVKIFDRITPATQRSADQIMPPRAYKRAPIEDPEILVVTCMKDEGPFILEWIAWHQAVGVTDFVIYSNDCSDGTDRILDRLAEWGLITHLPNPALASSSAHFQPYALTYTHFLANFAQADFVISMDVDEFINVRIGQGTLSDLFHEVGDFDVLSITEINHGSNKIEAFEPGWVTDQFPLHESETPGRRKCRRGIKSITRLSPRVEKIRNHRPDLNADNGTVRWRDGSGRELTSLMQDASENGIDSRGTYDLVSLDHFAVRSLQSYLVKMFRGDVVVKDKQVSRRYWRLRNRNELETSRFDRLNSAAHLAYDALLADRTLAQLHAQACAAHSNRIAQIVDQPQFRERREWIFENAWE